MPATLAFFRREDNKTWFSFPHDRNNWNYMHLLQCFPCLPRPVKTCFSPLSTREEWREKERPWKRASPSLRRVQVAFVESMIVRYKTAVTNNYDLQNAERTLRSTLVILTLKNILVFFSFAKPHQIISSSFKIRGERKLPANSASKITENFLIVSLWIETTLPDMSSIERLEIQIPYYKHHKVSSLVKSHQNTNNFVKDEVMWK